MRRRSRSGPSSEAAIATLTTRRTFLNPPPPLPLQSLTMMKTTKTKASAAKFVDLDNALLPTRPHLPAAPTVSLLPHLSTHPLPFVAVAMAAPIAPPVAAALMAVKAPRKWTKTLDVNSNKRGRRRRPPCRRQHRSRPRRPSSTARSSNERTLACKNTSFPPLRNHPFRRQHVG